MDTDCVCLYTPDFLMKYAPLMSRAVPEIRIFPDQVVTWIFGQVLQNSIVSDIITRG